MRQNLGRNLWSFICLYLVCVCYIMGYILPSPCPRGERMFLPQSEIEAVCNNTNDDKYKEAPHYADEDVFLSKTYDELLELVFIGNVTSLYRQNYTRHFSFSNGQNPTPRKPEDNWCTVDQEYYMMNIEVKCILKYKPKAQYIFPLPRVLFFKSDCPPRDIAIGDEVIASVSFYPHGVISTSESSFYKRDARVLSEIMKTCGFQDEIYASLLRPKSCPALNSPRGSCIDRNSAGGQLSKGSLIISIIYMLFVMMVR